MSAGAFARLRALLDGVPPAPGLAPVEMHLGRTRPADGPLRLPDGDRGWDDYPPPGGTPELRAAYLGWLGRRFGVHRAVAGGRLAVEPTPGTKQSVSVAIALAVRRARGREPVVVLPNPYYPSYRDGAEAAGAAVEYYPVGGDPVAGVADAVRRAPSAPAAIVVCHPGNPCGEVLTAAALTALARLAAAAGALLIVDECYADSWRDAPPPGLLPLVEDGVIGPDGPPFLVLHSLSKRSAAPGLRSGFLAGSPDEVAGYARVNRGCGVSAPWPVCRAATALWSDDGLAERIRRGLATNWGIADAELSGLPGYRAAAAGMYLWLPVGDDERVARTLWRDHAVRVMPGRYLSATGADGTDPGAGHVRVALVDEPDVVAVALRRIRDALGDPVPAGPAARPAPAAGTARPAGTAPPARTAKERTR